MSSPMKWKLIIMTVLVMAFGAASLVANPKPASPPAEDAGTLQIGPGGAGSKPAPTEDSKKSVIPRPRLNTNGIFNATIQGTQEIFSSDLALNIPLFDVLLLVVVVNVLALFNKPRGIMAFSYLFCLKWVFWSNYKYLYDQSDIISTASSSVFVICGVLMVALFVVNRFNPKS